MNVNGNQNVLGWGKETYNSNRTQSDKALVIKLAWQQSLGLINVDANRVKFESNSVNSNQPLPVAYQENAYLDAISSFKEDVNFSDLVHLKIDSNESIQRNISQIQDGVGDLHSSQNEIVTRTVIKDVYYTDKADLNKNIDLSFPDTMQKAAETRMSSSASKEIIDKMIFSIDKLKARVEANDAARQEMGKIAIVTARGETSIYSRDYRGGVTFESEKNLIRIKNIFLNCGFSIKKILMNGKLIR